MQTEINEQGETPTTPSLDQIVSPLLTLLNDQYPIDPDDPYAIPQYDEFGALEESQNQIAIRLPNAFVSNEMATRGIATLLQQSASILVRDVNQSSKVDPYRSPLEFALLKRFFLFEGH